MIEQSPLADAIQDAWLNATVEDCRHVADRLADFLGCNQHDVWSALTNLGNLCWHDNSQLPTSRAALAASGEE